MKRDDGGPAFPTPRNEYGENAPSMSVRDFFAAHALVGICAAPFNEEAIPEMARGAYVLADAMLKERDKP